MSLLIGRLIPLIAFNLINYAAALTEISWWTFLWATGTGILPLTILLNVVGDQMLTVPALGLAIAWCSWHPDLAHPASALAGGITTRKSGKRQCWQAGTLIRLRPANLYLPYYDQVQRFTGSGQDFVELAL